MKSFYQFLIHRVLAPRPFFYAWEERAFEQKQLQHLNRAQNTCRFGRD